MFDTYSVIDMFGPVHGDNWHVAEILDGVTFRWTGPSTTSTVKIPTLGAREIRVRWIFAFPPTDEQLSGIVCIVDGKSVDVQWALRGAYASLWSDVSLWSSSPVIVASLTTANIATTPEDPRERGLAVNRVEVFALTEAVIGEKARQIELELSSANRVFEQNMNALLQEVVQLREKLDAVYASTSWKFSAPLRWLKQNISN